MKTDKITIFELFEKQKRYLVPIFQRGYVWTLGNQWQPLWENILDQVSILHDQALSSSGTMRSHFLGAFVLMLMPYSFQERFLWDNQVLQYIREKIRA